MGQRYLEGEVRADRPLPHAYSVDAGGERFFRHADQWFRRNEIWRQRIDRRTGDRVAAELVKRSCALVTYVAQETLVNPSAE